MKIKFRIMVIIAAVMIMILPVAVYAEVGGTSPYENGGMLGGSESTSNNNNMPQTGAVDSITDTNALTGTNSITNENSITETAADNMTQEADNISIGAVIIGILVALSIVVVIVMFVMRRRGE